MRTLFVLLSLATAPLAVGLTGCGAPPPTVVVQSETLNVGCGTCIFKQVGGQGCYWAAEVGDQVYPMRGTALLRLARRWRIWRNDSTLSSARWGR